MPVLTVPPSLPSALPRPRLNVPPTHRVAIAITWAVSFLTLAAMALVVFFYVDPSTFMPSAVSASPRFTSPTAPEGSLAAASSSQLATPTAHLPRPCLSPLLAGTPAVRAAPQSAALPPLRGSHLGDGTSCAGPPPDGPLPASDASAAQPSLPSPSVVVHPAHAARARVSSAQEICATALDCKMRKTGIWMGLIMFGEDQILLLYHLGSPAIPSLLPTILIALSRAAMLICGPKSVGAQRGRVRMVECRRGREMEAPTAQSLCCLERRKGIDLLFLGGAVPSSKANQRRRCGSALHEPGLSQHFSFDRTVLRPSLPPSPSLPRRIYGECHSYWMLAVAAIYFAWSMALGTAVLRKHMRVHPSQLLLEGARALLGGTLNPLPPSLPPSLALALRT